jgi:hypothetical protein
MPNPAAPPLNTPEEATWWRAGTRFFKNWPPPTQNCPKLCLPAGEKHILILPGKEKQFMAALARLGYMVPQLREQI